MNVISNAKWNAFSQLFKVGIQIVNLVYLATIIPPAEYGIMAMAAVVINFGILLRDLGTSAAIIQTKILTEELKNTVFWINVTMGLALALIICAISPLISFIYNQKELIPILCLLSLSFPLSSSAATHMALLERDSNFKKVSTIEVSSSLASVVVAVVLANMGYGVYSLVWQAITLSLLSTLQFWFVSKWAPSIRSFINIKELKGIFGFSANLSFFNLINYFSRNMDSFLIGKYMSLVVLGSYNLAYRIMLFPLQSLTFIVSRSLFPVLSNFRDDNLKIRSTYINCVFVVLMITAPLMSGLAFYSSPFISLFFGDKWVLTADILQLLAPTAIIQSVLSTSGVVFMSKGRTDILMRLGVLGAILQVSAFMIGVKFDIKTFAMFYLIANILNFFPVMYFLMRLIDGSLSSLFKSILPVLLSTIGMLCVLVILKIYYPILSDKMIPHFIVSVLIGALSYTFFLFLTSLKFKNAVNNIIKKI